MCLFFECPMYPRGHAENRTKRKGTLRSLRDSPVLLAFIGTKINLLRSDKFLFTPMKVAMLGCIEGVKVKTRSPRRVALPSIAQNPMSSYWWAMSGYSLTGQLRNLHQSSVEFANPPSLQPLGAIRFCYCTLWVGFINNPRAAHPQISIGYFSTNR